MRSPIPRRYHPLLLVRNSIGKYIQKQQTPRYILPPAVETCDHVVPFWLVALRQIYIKPLEKHERRAIIVHRS